MIIVAQTSSDETSGPYMTGGAITIGIIIITALIFGIPSYILDKAKKDATKEAEKEETAAS